MRHILALHGGTFYHESSYTDPEIGRWLSRIVHVRQADDADFDAADVVLLPDRIHPDVMGRHKERLARLLARGGTVVTLATDGAAAFLPGIDWSPREVNFWWWVDEGAEPGIHVTAPDHPMFQAVRPEDTIWHYHGVFAPPPGAVSLVKAADGGTILYDDRASTPGRLIVTSLDPLFHHGSHFMPASSRFIKALLPWLAEGDG